MAAYPGQSNTYVPSFEASGGLQIGFTRNVADFALNKYIKRVPVKKDVGYYLVITAEEAARVINSNLSDFVWADGQEAPMGNDNTESFAFNKYSTVRYAFPFTLGQKSVEQADWKILQVHAGIAAQKAMTALTINVWNTLTTSGNWGGNTDTATDLAGGLADAGSSTNPYLKILIQAVAEKILQATLGVVKRKDLVMVVNPNCAGKLAKSGEIIDLIKQSPDAYAMLRQDDQFNQWGLPPILYGIKVVVEDAVKVTSKKGASKTTAYCAPNQDIVFLARPGGIMGQEGIPQFSTCQVFSYEEMTVEQKNDSDNRRQLGRVVDDNAPALVAPAAGYFVTSATS